MASGNGSSDGLGAEQHTRTKSLGKATLEENKTSAALESLSGPEKNRNPNIPSTQNVVQNLTPLSKGKQALQDSKYGHDSIDQSKQSSTSWRIPSFRDGLGIFSSSDERVIALVPSSSSQVKLIQAFQETDTQSDGPNSAKSTLQGITATIAPAGATSVEPNVGSVVALLGEASLEPNGDALVVSNDVDRAEPLVLLHGVAPAQSNVALIVAPSGEVPAQPNIGPNVAPPARGVALVQPDVASHAQGNGGPPAPVQPNAALIVTSPVVAIAQPNAAVIVAPPGIAIAQPNAAVIVAPPGIAIAQPNAVLIVAPPVVAIAQPNAAVIVAPPGIAIAQPNAALIVAPPAVVVLDVNFGLKRSRLKPLRTCEIGSEGHFWIKLP